MELSEKEKDELIPPSVLPGPDDQDVEDAFSRIVDEAEEGEEPSLDATTRALADQGRGNIGDPDPGSDLSYGNRPVIEEIDPGYLHSIQALHSEEGEGIVEEMQERLEDVLVNTDEAFTEAAKKARVALITTGHILNAGGDNNDAANRLMLAGMLKSEDAEIVSLLNTEKDKRDVRELLVGYCQDLLREPKNASTFYGQLHIALEGLTAKYSDMLALGRNQDKGV